ncbi:MAG: ubiquinone biosynthesis regulatory protein kinase UbiB [Alphaproteobacteria bacterium]|jgi:ubiquinone biosynthesis protein|nr:ubiquinone biosynthesis regulatory protein kinase UbiB [Alphaproteobacteria bacterium]
MALLRFIHLGLLFVRYNCFFILGLLNSKWLFLFNILYNKKSQKQAVRFAKFLSAAGPVFIKLAQLMSTRVDLFSEVYLEELKKLRDKVKPIPYKKIVKVIEADFGAKIEEIFLEINKEAIASASVAQVHKAKLLDGSEVIVKVIKPKTTKLFKQDIALLKILFSILQNTSKRGKTSKPLRIINHLEDTMKLELDLRFEAAAMDELKENFNGESYVYIPKVYWNYVSESCLVEEFINGVSLNNIYTLKQGNYSLDKITRNLATIFFLQVLQDGYFHGDMHSGNIFVLPDEVICFVDFGIMGRISPSLRKYLFDVFTAFVNKDYKKAAEIHFKAGWVSSKYNVDDFALACRSIMAKLLDKPQKDIKIGELLRQLFIISGNFEMEIQEDLLLLQKNLMYLENLGRVLSPDENLWMMSKEIIAENINTHQAFKESLKDKYHNFLVDLDSIKNSFINRNQILQENNNILLNNSKWYKRFFVLVVIIIVLLILK